MTIYKCKMCGAPLNNNGDALVLECEWCGTQQSIEEAEVQKKESLYENAKQLIEQGDKDSISTAVAMLKAIPGWRDADSLYGKYRLKGLAYTKYKEYLNKYPVMNEREQLDDVWETLIQSLRETKTVNSAWGKVSLVIALIAIVCVVMGFSKIAYIFKSWTPSLLIVLGLIFLGLSFVFFMLKVLVRRFAIVSAIDEYENKRDACSGAPDFYEFAPELQQYKSVVDQYLFEEPLKSKRQLTEDWEKQRDRVLEKRENEKKRRFQLAEEQLKQDLENLEHQAQAIKEKYAAEKERLQHKKDSMVSQLASLGILQFSARKELKEKIPHIDEELADLPEQQMHEMNALEIKRVHLKEKHEQRKQGIEQSIIAQFSIPKSPDEEELDSRMAIAEKAITENINEEKRLIRTLGYKYCATKNKKVRRYMKVRK